MKTLKMIFLSLLLISPTWGQQSKRIFPPENLIKFLGVTARDVRVKGADIDGDNKLEYFVKKIRKCDLGNCQKITLYQLRGNEYIELFSISNVDWLDVGAGSRNGVRDLIAYGELLGVYGYYHYRWDGDEYVPDGCSRIIKSGKNKGRRVETPCSE